MKEDVAAFAQTKEFATAICSMYPGAFYVNGEEQTTSLMVPSMTR